MLGENLDIKPYQKPLKLPIIMFSIYSILKMSNPFFEVIYEDSNPFYIIPAGTELYRGDYFFDSHVKQSLEYYTIPPIFFGFDKESVEKYGIVYKFTTKQEMRCIATDLLTESSPFYDTAPEHIKEILRKNYGVISKKRVSEPNPDKKLAEYICGLQLDGYAANRTGFELDILEPEIAICNIRKINTTGTLVSVPPDVQSKRMEIRNKREREEKRRKNKREFDVENDENDDPNPIHNTNPLKPTSLFSFDSPLSSPTKTGKGLFGSSFTPPGGSKNTKKKRVHRKSKRKSNKKRRTYKK